jgi:chromosomal replication initiation ATPase DnaA
VAWLKQLEIKSFIKEQKQLILTSNNSFVAEYVSKNYKKGIKNALKKLDIENIN